MTAEDDTSSSIGWLGLERIDLVCVDRNSNREKGDRVQYMGPVHRTADNGLAWLGQDV